MENVKKLIECLTRGHRWDTSPHNAPRLMRCARCGLLAEPVPHLH